jgi:hypothetical protein
MPTPFVLTSSAVTDVVAPLDSPTLVVEALHVVATSVPNPTLSNGRPV